MPQARRARQRLATDLRTVARDTENLVEATADDLGNNARAARRKIAKTVDRAKTATLALRQRGVDAATQAWERTDETVRANPWRTAGIAFGVGVLAGALMRRK